MIDRSFPLTKRFALFAGLICVAASLLLIAIFQSFAGEGLKDLASRKNVAVARVFSHEIWESHAGFLTTAHFLSPEAIRQHPETRAIRDQVMRRMPDLSSLKIKIYDLNGLTVFSTDPQQIGEDKSDNAGFMAARLGKPRNELTHRNHFTTFDHEVYDRDVLESYVPIISDSGAIEGVVDVYYDVTELLASTEQSQRAFQLAVGVTFLLVYLILVSGVWRGEKRSLAQQRRTMELARTAAAAEESNRLKSEFLATMSHELRTPLNAILGFSEILKSQVVGANDVKARREYAQAIWSSGRHLLNIVDDVLDMSKVEAGKFELKREFFDPAETADGALRIVETQADGRGVALSCDVAAQLPPSFGDERRIKQILINLLSNAVKFTPAGGKVGLWVGPTQNGDLMFAVTDTGIGIKAEDIERVMAPFGQVESSYTRQFNGTGLGLPIAKSLIEMHGGRFVLESQSGKGTKISFTLPRPAKHGSDDSGQDDVAAPPIAATG